MTLQWVVYRREFKTSVHYGHWWFSSYKPKKILMMMMNCFCGMAERRKEFSLNSSRDHCQRSSPSRISDKPRAGFEPAQNLSSGFVKWNCALVITTTPQRHVLASLSHYLYLRQFFQREKLEGFIFLGFSSLYFLPLFIPFNPANENIFIDVLLYDAN